jgi:predicted DNA-binding transcriptional regulator YafY
VVGWRKEAYTCAKGGEEEMKNAMNESDENRVVTITYTNHKNETRDRKISPTRIWFGQTKFHPVDQWFLEAWCHEKEATRDFAIKDIAVWTPTIPK